MHYCKTVLFDNNYAFHFQNTCLSGIFWHIMPKPCWNIRTRRSILLPYGNVWPSGYIPSDKHLHRKIAFHSQIFYEYWEVYPLNEKKNPPHFVLKSYRYFIWNYKWLKSCGNTSQEKTWLPENSNLFFYNEKYDNYQIYQNTRLYRPP